VSRVPLILLFIVFIVVPIIELWVILQVADLLGGDATGAALTILLLIADSILGAWLVRSQGRAVWRQFVTALQARRMPAAEAINGALVIVGGVLLLTPGFLSDIAGVLMVAPPTRKVIAASVYRMLAKRVKGAIGFADTGLRDFPHSEQPPGPTPGAADTDDDPDFDFDPRNLNG
jgi:UPF0716 protein FxsA